MPSDREPSQPNVEPIAPFKAALAWDGIGVVLAIVIGVARGNDSRAAMALAIALSAVIVLSCALWLHRSAAVIGYMVGIAVGAVVGLIALFIAMVSGRPWGVG